MIDLRGAPARAEHAVVVSVHAHVLGDVLIPPGGHGERLPAEFLYRAERVPHLHDAQAGPVLQHADRDAVAVHNADRGRRELRRTAQQVEAVADPRGERVADHAAEVDDAHRGVSLRQRRADLLEIRAQLIALPADHHDFPLHGQQLERRVHSPVKHLEQRDQAEQDSFFHRQLLTFPCG